MTTIARLVLTLAFAALPMLAQASDPEDISWDMLAPPTAAVADNQIVHVVHPDGIEVNGLCTPVWITGTMTARSSLQQVGHVDGQAPVSVSCTWSKSTVAERRRIGSTFSGPVAPTFAPNARPRRSVDHRDDVPKSDVTKTRDRTDA